MDVVGKTVTGMAKYIDREALVEWLKRIPLKDLSDGRGLCRVIFEDDFKRAIKKIPKGIIVDVAPVRHGQWISVKDRLPEDQEEVLVCTCSKNGIRNIDKGYMAIDHFIHRGRAEVTHWMPLPQPPKGE